MRRFFLMLFKIAVFAALAVSCQKEGRYVTLKFKVSDSIVTKGDNPDLPYIVWNEGDVIDLEIEVYDEYSEFRVHKPGSGKEGSKGAEYAIFGKMKYVSGTWKLSASQQCTQNEIGWYEDEPVYQDVDVIKFLVPSDNFSVFIIADCTPRGLHQRDMYYNTIDQEVLLDFSEVVDSHQPVYL